MLDNMFTLHVARISLIVALVDKKYNLSDFNHTFKCPVYIQINTTLGEKNGFCFEEDYLCFGLVRKVKKKIMAAGLTPFPKFDVYSEESSVGYKMEKICGKTRKFVCST